VVGGAGRSSPSNRSVPATPNKSAHQHMHPTLSQHGVHLRHAARTEPDPIGPTLAAVFVAEIGDISRFASASKLTCWAGLTPKHHESDTHVHRGRITKQGSRLVRWAAIESVKTIPKGSVVGVLRERVADHRGRNIGSVAAARRQLELVFYGASQYGYVRLCDYTGGK
jgi:hypothetical protein